MSPRPHDMSPTSRAKHTTQVSNHKLSPSFPAASPSSWEWPLFMSLGTKDTPKTQEESILKAGPLGCPQGRAAVDSCQLNRQSPLRTEICGESSLRSSKALGTRWQAIPPLQAEKPSSRTQSLWSSLQPLSWSTRFLRTCQNLPSLLSHSIRHPQILSFLRAGKPVLPLDHRIHYLQGPLRFTWLHLFTYTSEKWDPEGIKPHSPVTG